MSIWIDAGHGGKDPGAIGTGFIEKDQALAVALVLQKECIQNGKRAYLTRSDDRFVSLNKRVANLQKNDIFISIHFNASKTKQASGFEVYAMKNALCRAVLIEVLFIDNPEEMAKIVGTNYYKELAIAIASAI